MSDTSQDVEEVLVRNTSPQESEGPEQELPPPETVENEPANTHDQPETRENDEANSTGQQTKHGLPTITEVHVTACRT